MVATSNAIAKIAAVVAGLGLVATSFASFAVPAKAAMTSAEMEALIASLQAQLASLTGGSSASAGTTFTMDLTLGSSGSEVTALQNWLISKGYSIPAGATGYFGAQTQAALAAYQAANGISPAAGYFGPVTRAKVNAAGGSTGSTGGSTGGLQGGAGSVDEYKLMSELNNEEVGEDEEDAQVAGLEIEADDSSDLELTAVRLVFDESADSSEDGSDNAFNDFEDYATEVSIWLDDEEVARVDADEFDDDNSWTKTISLDKGAIIRAGETGELVVALTGNDNLDSGDLNDHWDVDFEQVRFRDADGATISDNPATSEREFIFVSFASATDAEFKIAEDDEEVNESRTIEVDDNDTTDDVEVMSMTFEAEGDSDMEIKKLGVSVSTTGATTAEDLFSDIRLIIDGEEYSGDYVYSSGDAYVFEDIDYVLGAGETVSASIVVDLLSTGAALDEGDTFTLALGETQTNNTALTDIEDEAGENLGNSEKTGTVNSGPFEVRTAGPMVTFISADEAVTVGQSGNDDVGTFTIKYNVEAFGDTIYVSTNAVATLNTASNQPSMITGSAGVVFLIERGGSATIPDNAALYTSDVDYTDADGNPVDGTNGVVIEEGESADFTLTVSKTDAATSVGGLYRVALKAIGWDTEASGSDWNLYDFDLDDYKTDAVSLN